MSLIFKKAARENLSKISVYVTDTSATSPKYFRVSDVPQVLTKGKNLIRISAHPTNLVAGSQILVDVRDSNGNPIYFEIPNYLEHDKSRVISIWIYHDKGEDNTANGEATITLVGVSHIGNNGESVPSKFRGTPNVRWQTIVSVDRARSNTSPVIFETTNIPEVVISESIEVYINQPQNGSRLNLVTDSGSNATYYYKGTTPIVKLNDGTFNGEMLNYSIVLSDFSAPATPITKLKNPLSSTFYSSSIDTILNENTAILKTPFTTSFDGIVDTTHTYEYIDNANWNVNYFRSGSNVTTENQRSFANITLNGVDPIVGVVDKVKVLIKSDGLPGEYELLNEVTVPFSSSINIKVPVPSENLKDPKRFKIQYLNSIGEISRTETITEPFVFQGGNTYIGGGNNLISGSVFISDAIGSGIEIGGVSSGFIRSVGFDGQTSASLGKGPGGFVIYSGSNNLQIGEDVLTGVGMQMVGDNDDRHLIFTTANGGLLDVKADKFFVGTTQSQYISGSDGNIEISSSNFHLDSNGNVIMTGTITARDGTIGGFEITDTTINSTNNLLILSSSGRIFAQSGRIAGFEVTQSNFDALRTVEVFSEVANNTASFTGSPPVPTKVTSGDELVVGGSTYTISSRLGNASVELTTDAYQLDEPFVLKYKSEEQFIVEPVTLMSSSVAIQYISRTLFAVTGSIVSSNYPDDSYAVINGNPALDETVGLYTIFIERPAGTFSGGNFNGDLFSSNIVSLDSRVDYWNNISPGLDLELQIEPDFTILNQIVPEADRVNDGCKNEEFFKYIKEFENGIEGVQRLNNASSLSGITSSWAPLADIGNTSVAEWNSTYVSGGGFVKNVNYTTSDYYPAMLKAGWIINPIWSSYLSNINTAPASIDTNNTASWLDTELNTGTNQTYFRSTSAGSTPNVVNGVAFKITHNLPIVTQTLSNELKLGNGQIWPIDIADSGSIVGGTLRDDVFHPILQRTVKIKSRLDATRIETDLTSSDLSKLSSYNGSYDTIINYQKPNIFTGGTVSIGSLSGSFVEKVTFRISGSGELSSSNFFLNEFGDITASNVNFTGGIISGSDLTINANQFEFSNENGTIFGDSSNFIISSSLFSLNNNNLLVKGDVRSNSGYIQDAYLGGKIVETGVINPNVPNTRYQIPFIETFSTNSVDIRLNSEGSKVGAEFQGSHGKWILSTKLQNLNQYLTSASADNVGYPVEFKSWYDISSVSNDYKYISNFNQPIVAAASASLTQNLIGNQLIFNSASVIPTGSSVPLSLTSEFINISESLSDTNGGYRNVHLQFAVRGTTHPYDGGFKGFAPQYTVDIISGSNTFFTKTYKDENATEKNWVVFDIPITDIVTVNATSNTDRNVHREFKIKVSMNYSGSSATGTLGSGVNGIGFALTEMRMVEPARITSIDTQTIHFKDTYFTWGNTETTAHKGNLVPVIQSQSNTVSSSFSLGTPTHRWKDVYLGIPQNDITSAENVENKLVRIDLNSGRLSYATGSIFFNEIDGGTFN